MEEEEEGRVERDKQSMVQTRKENKIKRVDFENLFSSFPKAFSTLLRRDLHTPI